ncbi:uncharacterized protein [Palaemon carinicauda]|uniref:uncharacterized protein n=1 Tax=Palaemon carinicauda TaxID=392227 RepID=UPI0035B5CA58
MKLRLPNTDFRKAVMPLLFLMMMMMALLIAEASHLPAPEGHAPKAVVDLAKGVGGVGDVNPFVSRGRYSQLAHERARRKAEQTARYVKKYVDERQGNNRLSLEDVNFEPEHDERYIGFCQNAYIRMWPGNSRKFWSYGYVYLGEPYLANCTMLYYYNTRRYPSDDFCKFGFKVRGSFEGHTDSYATCTDTDYVFLNDSNGNEAYYCGTYSDIEWTTIEDSFEFHFVTKEDSPRARGFFTIIESFKLCGGAYNIENDGPTGTFRSPNFPLNYPGNVACNWFFQSPSNEGYEVSVRIRCDQFALQEPFDNGTEYCLDAMSFTFEAPYPSDTQTYCSSTLDEENHVVYGTHGPMLVSFRTDELVADSGFNCTYEYILYGE